MGGKLADTENAARYVGGSKFDAKTARLLVTAFDRERKDADGLSFNRTGILSSVQADDDNQIRAIIASRIIVGKNAVFAEMNVGDVSRQLEHFGGEFQFEADPLEPEGTKMANPVHALLIGLPFVGETIDSLKSEVANDLLTQVVRRIFWANSTKAGDPVTFGGNCTHTLIE